MQGDGRNWGKGVVDEIADIADIAAAAAAAAAC